jgi:hypothetical protein
MKLERYPMNAPGPFYVVNGDCIACEAPQAEAPGLIAFDCSHCYFRKQPETPEEVTLAIGAMVVSCVRALHYARDDFLILERLKRLGLVHCCDRLPPKKWWQFWK